jgi:heat shock protein HslJ
MALTLAAVVAGAIAAPAAAQDEPSPSIEGPVWELLNIGDAAAEASATMSLNDGTASTFGGCNSFFGSYTLDGDSLTFADDFTSTLVECEPAVMEQEQAYIAALGDVAGYAVQDDILDLLDDGGGQVLSFEETSVATTTDIAALQFEIEKVRANLQHLRGRVQSEDVRGDVKGLEAHLNQLTQQHIKQHSINQELRGRIHSLERQVAMMQQALVLEGIMTIDDE